MKKLNKKIIATVVLATTASSAFAQGVSLADVISQTLENHPEYKQSQELIKSAEFGVKEAKGGYYPKVDAALGTGYERVENLSTINRGLATGGSKDVDLNRQEASLTLRQMIFDGFKTSSRVEKSQSQLQNQISFSNEVKEKVAALATRAYYDVLREQTNLLIDEQNLATHKKYQKQIEKRVRSGKSNRADLEQINSRVALAASQVVQRQELLEQAKADFFRQVGFEAQNLKGNEVDFSLVPTTLKEAVNVAFISSPRIKSAEHEFKTSSAAVREAKAAYAPTLNLELSAKRDQNVDGIKKKDHSEQAMFRVKYNLFNGGSDKARHLGALAEKQATIKKVEDIKRDVVKDVRAVWYEYLLTTKRLQSLSDQVKASNATKQAYKAQFDVGQRTLLDVLDSEREYNFALTAFEGAKNSRDFSVYQLLSLLGKLTDSFEGRESLLKKEDYKLKTDEGYQESSIEKAGKSVNNPPVVVGLQSTDNTEAGNAKTEIEMQQEREKELMEALKQIR